MASKWKLKPFLYFLFSSMTLATAGYYLLRMVMPHHYVFGALFRMFVYHWQYPVQYILIVSLAFASIAIWFLEPLRKGSTMNRIGITLLIIVLTILVSSPIGGMLWHYHDIISGYWPEHWAKKIFIRGPVEGLQAGWLIILLSIPYAYFGTIVCYFLLADAARRFAAPTVDRN